MTRAEFNKRVRNMLKDVKEGYYGMEELFDEVWDYINNEQMRNKELWKEVQKLRKNYLGT